MNNISPTLLFKEVDKVKKFFTILKRMNRSIPIIGDIYKGHDKSNPDISLCQKEVFVNRTIAKWFKSKFIILYYKSNIDIQYNLYISVSLVKYYLGYKDQILLYYFDYSKPYETFNQLLLSEYDVLNFEGKFIDDPTNYHNKLFELIRINEPDRKYTYKVYNNSTLDSYFVDIIAKTLFEAKKEIISYCDKEHNNCFSNFELINVS
jgi:hypothetical protein